MFFYFAQSSYFKYIFMFYVLIFYNLIFTLDIILFVIYRGIFFCCVVW